MTPAANTSPAPRRVVTHKSPLTFGAAGVHRCLIGCMTFQKNDGAPGTPAILAPQVQQAVWFMGALVRVRASGENTAGCLDVLEQEGERGYSSPLHRHLAEEETFFVLDGEPRVELGGEACRWTRGGRVPAAAAAARLRGDQPAGLVPHRAHTGRVRQVHPRCRNARNWHDHDATRGAMARPSGACGHGEVVRHRDPGSASRAVTRDTAYSLLVVTATP